MAHHPKEVSSSQAILDLDGAYANVVSFISNVLGITTNIDARSRPKKRFFCYNLWHTCKSQVLGIMSDHV